MRRNPRTARRRPAAWPLLIDTTEPLLRATARWVLDGLFPYTCVGCGKEGAFLCTRCLDDVPWLREPWCSRCGLPLGSGPSRPCGRCMDRSPRFGRLRAVVAYRAVPDLEDPVTGALRAMKYGHRRALAGPLSELFARHFPFGPDEFDGIVPVPLHVSRLRERGFNQAVLLAREPARRLRRTVDPLALERTAPTPFQVGLDERERRRNLRGAIRVRRPASVRGRRIVLVDDVATSLATAEACTRELLRAGATSVDVAVLGRTSFHGPSAFGFQPRVKSEQPGSN